MSVWEIELPVRIKEDGVERIATPNDVIGAIDADGWNFRLTEEFYPDANGVIVWDKIKEIVGYTPLTNPPGGYSEYILKVTYIPDTSKYWQHRIRVYETTWTLV